MISYMRWWCNPTVAIICMRTTSWWWCWWLHLVLILINLVLVIVLLHDSSSRSYRSINSSSSGTRSLSCLKRNTLRSPCWIATRLVVVVDARILHQTWHPTWCQFSSQYQQSSPGPFQSWPSHLPPIDPTFDETYHEAPCWSCFPVNLVDLCSCHS